MSAQQRKVSDIPATLGELQPLLLPIGDSPTITTRQGMFTVIAQSHRLRCSGNSLALLARVGLIVSIFMLAVVPAVISWRTMSSSTLVAGGTDSDSSIIPETNSPENQAAIFWTSEQQQQYPLKDRSGDQNFIEEGKYSVHHHLNKDAINAREYTLNKAGATAEEPPPNVIFILLDDVGMNDIGYTSTDGLATVTPFMDSLAFQGVRISEYYTAHLCTPARASLMTGRYTFRYGMQYGELDNSMPWGLPLNEVTLAERFKAAGYATHMVGKWNLGMYAEDYYPFNRGFDSFLGYMGPLETYYGHNHSEHFDFDEPGKQTTYKDFGYGDINGYLDLKKNTTRLGPEMEGKYSTSLTANRAVQVAHNHLAENTANGTVQPLFMYLAFQAAHTPLGTPADELYTEDELEVLSAFTFEEPVRTRFINIMLFLDITLKRMITELDTLGVMDNTLLVLTSDNGGCPSGGGSNYPYRGFKHTLFDGGVRAPAFVYSKSTSILPPQARGTTYEGLMHVTDWTATLASVTGIPTDHLGEPLDGLDHWPAIVGQAEGANSTSVRTDVVLGCNSYSFDSESESMALMATGTKGAYIYDGWKINIGDKCAGWYSFNPNDSIITDTECKVQVCPTCDDGCNYEDSLNSTFLFHLETDPYEEVNLLADMPEKFAEMEQRLKQRCDGEVVPIYKPEDPSSIEKWRTFHDYAVAWQ